MSGSHATSVASPFRQPKAVFAVAFACVVSFMGIGLVDPILPAISHELHASPSEVTLLFTSYLVVTAVAMLITNTTAHGLLTQAERIQAEQVTGSASPAAEPDGAGPVGALIPVEVNTEAVRLAAHHVPAEGQILLHAADHGAAAGWSPSTPPPSGPARSWSARPPTAGCPR